MKLTIKAPDLGALLFLLDEWHSCLFTFLSHFLWPDTCLNLTDVSLVEQYHAESALSDTTSDRERELAFEQCLVEVKFLALCLSFEFELAEKALLVNADAHA